MKSRIEEMYRAGDGARDMEPPSQHFHIQHPESLQIPQLREFMEASTLGPAWLLTPFLAYVPFLDDGKGLKVPSFSLAWSF